MSTGSASENITAKDTAYTAVYEGPDEGRQTAGWYLGLAVRDEAGYHQCKPGFGPYVNEDGAREHARELNSKLGHSDEQAMAIVTSSIATQVRGSRRRRPAAKRRRGV